MFNSKRPTTVTNNPKILQTKHNENQGVFILSVIQGTQFWFCFLFLFFNESLKLVKGKQLF